MTSINIHAAKTNLSKIIAGLETDGGEALLCRAGKPVAKLTALPQAGRRMAGLLQGQVDLAADFDTPVAMFGLEP